MGGDTKEEEEEDIIIMEQLKNLNIHFTKLTQLR